MTIEIIIDEQIVMTITKQTIDFILTDKDQEDITITKDGTEITLRFKKTGGGGNETI